MKIDFVIGVDWESIYIDGELVIDGRDISAYALLKILQCRGVVTEFKYHEIDEEYLRIVNRLPRLYKDIKKDAMLFPWDNR